MLTLRPELRIPIMVRLLFVAALAVIGLEASGFIAAEDLPFAHIAVALFAVAAVVWALVALMRFRR